MHADSGECHSACIFYIIYPVEITDAALSANHLQS